jgi:hypothetical protein
MSHLDYMHFGNDTSVDFRDTHVPKLMLFPVSNFLFSLCENAYHPTQITISKDFNAQRALLLLSLGLGYWL